MSRSIRGRLLSNFAAAILIVVLIGIGLNFLLLRLVVRHYIEATLEGSNDFMVDTVRLAAENVLRGRLRNEVENGLSVIGTLNDLAAAGVLSLDRAKRLASEHLLSVRIGSTGYFYVIDSKGNVLVHPATELVGTNQSSFSFVARQMSEKTGYLEYDWANPADRSPRPKTLYMTHFEPWDWIVSASAYRSEFHELIKAEDIRALIQSPRFAKSGYAYVLREDGLALVHPSLEGQNLADLGLGFDTSFFLRIRDRKKGKITYHWRDRPDGPLRDKLAVFRHVPELGWIVGTSGYLDEFHAPLGGYGLATLAYLILIVGVLVATAFHTSSRLARPIEELQVRFAEAVGGNLGVRAPALGEDEIGRLGIHFNTFMQRLENQVGEIRAAEERIRALAKFPDENPNPVFRLTMSGVVDYANAAALPLLTAWNSGVGRRLSELNLMQLRAVGGKNPRRELRFGRSIYAFSASGISDTDATFYYGQEITQQKAYEHLMLLSDTVFENALEGIMITDRDGVIVSVNPAFVRITGRDREEIIGNTPRLLRSNRHPPGFYAAMWHQLLTEGTWQGEIWNRRKDGEAYPEWLSITSLRDEHDTVTHFIGVFHDITEIKQKEEKLHYQAYHDALTGLPNRQLFIDRLDRAISSARRDNERLAVLFLDLDDFKKVNDSLGHVLGDQYLQLVAGRLQAVCREEDSIARLGGDEFVILLPHLHNHGNAVEIAKRIDQACREPISLAGHEVLPSVSVGIAFFPEDGEDPDTLLRNADLAMYNSKREGKRRHTLFNPSMNIAAQSKLALETALYRALRAGEITVFHQPVIHLASGRIVGSEALVRWVSADGPARPTADFIPTAEESDLILELGQIVLTTACVHAREIRGRFDPAFRVAVNLSARQLRLGDLPGLIETVLEKSGLAASGLELELTESAAMTDVEAASAIVSRLRGSGVRIAIDDFGTGYASLAYVQRFRPDALKVDRSFIRGVPEEADAVSITKAILSLAKELGIAVVAEGVETGAQAEFLRNLDCERVQGYLYSPPIPFEQFTGLLAAHHGADTKANGK